jgi:WD40 repeat protein
MSGSPPLNVFRCVTGLGVVCLLAVVGCASKPRGPILPPPAPEQVVFTPDGKAFAAAFEKVVKVWNASGTERTQFTVPDFVGALAFSHDGQTLAVGCADRSLSLWDATTGKEKRVLGGHKAPLKAAAFAPDGKFLATAAGDTNPFLGRSPDDNVPCEVKLWDAAGEPLGNLSGPGATIFCLAFSPDSQTLVTAGHDGKIKFWDPATRKQKASALEYCPEGVTCVSFSRDGKYLVSGCRNGNFQVWDTASWKVVASPGHHDNRINTATFSPSGKLLATSGDDGMVKIWETDGWTEKGKLKSADGREIYAAVFGADDATLATGGKDGAVRLWDVAKQPQERLTLR